MMASFAFAKQMKRCLGGYHRHLLCNTASFSLKTYFEFVCEEQHSYAPLIS